MSYVKIFPRYELVLNLLKQEGHGVATRFVFTNDVSGNNFIEVQNKIAKTMTDDLISISTQKALGQACGTFRIMLSPKPFKLGNKWTTWDELIDPADFVEINYFKTDGTKSPLFWGTVDDINYHVVYGEKPIQTIAVSGRDLGAYLIEQKTPIDKYVQGVASTPRPGGQQLNALKNISKLFQENGQIFGEYKIDTMTKKDLFKKLFEIFFKCVDGTFSNLQDDSNTSTTYQFQGLKFSNGRKFGLADSSADNEKIFLISFSSNELGAYPVVLKVFHDYNNFWAIINRVFNDTMYEIFTDVGGREITLDYEMEGFNFKTTILSEKHFHIIIRPRPFDGTLFEQDFADKTIKRKLFRDYKAKKINYAQLKEFNFTKTNKEVFNFYSSYPLIANISAYGAARMGTILNAPSIEKYGLRMMQAPIHHASPALTNKFVNKKYTLAFATDLARWYEYNDKYLSGEITVIGNLDIRIGDKIEFHWIEKKADYWFYVEGVSNEIDIQSLRCETKLRVTRGVKAYPGKAFPEFYSYLRENDDERLTGGEQYDANIGTLRR